jgi:hypothetical protein
MSDDGIAGSGHPGVGGLISDLMGGGPGKGKPPPHPSHRPRRKSKDAVEDDSKHDEAYADDAYIDCLVEPIEEEPLELGEGVIEAEGWDVTEIGESGVLELGA